jgi:hypothetical protein
VGFWIGVVFELLWVGWAVRFVLRVLNIGATIIPAEQLIHEDER